MRPSHWPLAELSTSWTEGRAPVRAPAQKQAGYRAEQSKGCLPIASERILKDWKPDTVARACSSAAPAKGRMVS